MRSLWRWFHRLRCCPRLRGVFSSAECFPDIPPNETYTKETKVGKLWQSFLQNQGTAAATSSDLRSFLPKTVQFGNDRESERSSPRGRGKDSLPEWVRAGPCCLPHRTRQASSSPNFDRSLRWFVVLLALLSHCLVARATRNCRYSCPVQRYWLKKHALQLQLRMVHMHARMHTTVRRSVVGLSSALWLVREFEFVRWGWLFPLLWSLDTSYWAYFFTSPTRNRHDKYAYDSW